MNGLLAIGAGIAALVGLGAGLGICLATSKAVEASVVPLQRQQLSTVS